MSSVGRRADSDSASSTTSQLPPSSGIAELGTTSDGESKSKSLAPDECALRKLDKLLGEVGDAKERLRLISKAIEHLREMREKLSAAG